MVGLGFHVGLAGGCGGGAPGCAAVGGVPAFGAELTHFFFGTVGEVAGVGVGGHCGGLRRCWGEVEEEIEVEVEREEEGREGQVDGSGR